MKTIHKYCLGSLSESKSINLKAGFRIVRAEYVLVDKQVYMWVQEPLGAEVPMVSRTFKVVMSGEPVPNEYVYRATAIDTFNPEAFHIFEVHSAETEAAADGEAVAARENKSVELEAA